MLAGLPATTMTAKQIEVVTPGYMESAYSVAFVDESQFVGGCSGGTVRRWKIEDRQERGLIDSAMAAPQSFLLPLPKMGDGSWPEMNSRSSGTRSLMKKCTCSHQ